MATDEIAGMGDFHTKILQKFHEYKENKSTNNDNFLVDFVVDLLSELPNDKYFDINSCILIHLPLAEQIKSLKMFIDHGETLFSAAVDISKLIYILWPRYHVPYQSRPLSYPHAEIYQLMFTIHQQLKDFAKTSHEQYFDFKKGTKFVFWHLCGLYPLLENGAEMLVKICQKEYDDAQDMMMFGIYQLNPFTHMVYVKEIFKHWKKAKNIDLYDTSTGCRQQLDLILGKYRFLEYEIDDELKEILQE